MPTPPKGAKAPTDRKPKSAPKAAPAKSDEPEDLKVDLRGMEVSVPFDALNDFELMDDLSQMDEGDMTAFPRVLRRLVGTQYGAVVELARDKDTKRITLEAGSELVFELLENLDPNS